MSDLIDRQAAIVTAVKAAIDWHRLANPQYSIAYCIGKAMSALPAAETIRCRDCANWNTVFDRNKAEYGLCKKRTQLEATRWDDFCSYAERRTDE